MITAICDVQDSGSGGLEPLTPPSQLSIFVAGQSLAEYPFIRGVPRVPVNTITTLRPLFGYATSGTPTGYQTGQFFHDGSNETAENWTVRMDNCASGGSAMLDVSQGGSQIATGNYWWNTQNNTAAPPTGTGNPLDVADSPGPLLRALLSRIETRVAAGFPPAVFVWSQGTTDMTADANLLTLYNYANLQVFNRVWAAVGSTIPIFYCLLGRHQTANDVGAENIRQIQRNITAQTERVYIGSYEYPYRMAETQAYTGAVISSTTNRIFISDTTNWSGSDGVWGPGIPLGAFVRMSGGVATSSSILVDIIENDVVLPITPTAASTNATIYRVDNVHLYPGADGIEVLDGPGGTTNIQTEGFYAEWQTLAQRIANIYNVSGITQSQGPFVSAAQFYNGAIKVPVTLTHGAGTDFTIGDTEGWRVTADDVSQGLMGVTKTSAASLDISLSSPLVGTTGGVQYAYGSVNRANYPEFVFDNASPYPFPIQETNPLVGTIQTAPAGPGPVSIVNTTNAVSATDGNLFSFSSMPLNTASSDRRILVGMCSRGGATPTVSDFTIANVKAALLATVTSGGTLSRTSLYIADVPTGTTGDVVVTFTSTGILRCGIGVWSITGANTFSVVSQSTTTVADPGTANLTIPANGAGVGYTFTGNGANPLGSSWVGLTEAFDVTVETGFTHSGANLESASGGLQAITITSTAVPANGRGAVFASFGP